MRCAFLVLMGCIQVSTSFASTPAAPIFTRSYHGQTSSNHYPHWEWAVGSDDAVYDYVLTTSWSLGTFVSPSSSFTPTVALPDGFYTIEVRARNASGQSAPSHDEIVISSTKAGNNEPGNGIYGASATNALTPLGTQLSDIVALRYMFHVDGDTSDTIKILFGTTRLFGAAPETYIIETNLYATGLRYGSGICTTWPLVGTTVARQSSLRIGAPDYVGDFDQTKGGRVGFKTRDTAFLPQQTYLIDNIPNLWKTDAITQQDMSGIDAQVSIARGDLVDSHSGWKCADDLSNDTYRDWHVSIALNGVAHDVDLALPEQSAAYILPSEMLDLLTEFFQQPGLFRVYYWDIAVQRASSPTWIPLARWSVWRHDGYAVDWGARRSVYKDRYVLELSNDGPAAFADVNDVIDLSGTPSQAKRRAISH